MFSFHVLAIFLLVVTLHIVTYLRVRMSNMWLFFFVCLYFAYDLSHAVSCGVFLPVAGAYWLQIAIQILFGLGYLVTLCGPGWPQTHSYRHVVLR